MNAIGYIRVSTDMQVNEGLSLDAQQERIEAWAKANGFKLLSVEVDAGKRVGNLVFTNKGEPIFAIQKAFDDAVAQARLSLFDDEGTPIRKLQFRDLRPTAASNMLDFGLSPRQRSPRCSGMWTPAWSVMSIFVKSKTRLCSMPLPRLNKDSKLANLPDPPTKGVRPFCL